MRVGILTGGGDCPGLNAVIRAAVRKGTRVHGDELIGFLDGYQGVVDQRSMRLDVEALRGKLPIGGTILGTSRYQPFMDDDGFDRFRQGLADQGIDAVIDGVRRRFRIIDAGDSVHVSSSLGNSTFDRVDPFPDPSASVEAGSLLAPMPGTVVRVEVSEGDEVSEGQTVIVLEAMKMEHSIKSPAAGTVSRLPVALGAQVDTGETLVVISGGDQE